MVENSADFFVKNVLTSTFDAGTTVRTYHMRYPRYIHAELMTYRVFSRNARSSRAVPSRRLLREPIVMPLKWGINQKGMQAKDEELTGFKRWLADKTWRTMARTCRLGVRVLNMLDVHKQWANRPLEWFGSIDVLVTSVYWDNFLVQRDHAAAMPEIEHLAKLVRRQIDEAPIQVLKVGEWHLPFIVLPEEASFTLEQKKIVSVSRCARISYVPFDGTPSTPESETNLYTRLMGGIPIHASPSEHQCTPDTKTPRGAWRRADLHGNLRGWIQFRKQHELEFFDEYRRTV